MHERRKPLWLRPKAERRVALLELQRECGFEPPAGWLRLLWRGGARRGALPVPPGAFVLWPAAEVLQLNQHFDVDDSYPGLFAFGSDGGPSMLAFDTRSGPGLPVVTAPFVGLSEEIRVVAESFDAFARLAGLAPSSGSREGP